MGTCATQIGGWAGRFRLARVMSALAMASALLGAMAQPSAAQTTNPNTELRMDLSKLYCYREDGDGLFDLHDEPYLVMFAADLSGPVPRALTLRSQIWQNVDGGETHHATQSMQVWDFDRTGSPILDPNKLIFLGAMMECDGPQPGYFGEYADAVVYRVQSDLLPKLFAYHASGLSRDTMVKNLSKDMDIAINAARSKDDRIGGAVELRLTMDDVLRARTGPWVPVTKTIRYGTGSTGLYYLTFVLQPSAVIIY
jgi:hypothetical protein